MSRVTDGPSLAPIIAFPTCTFSSHWHFQQRQSLLLRLLVFYNWLFKEIFFSLNISPLDIISVGSMLSSESFLLSDLHTYLTFCCPYLTSNWTAHLSQQPEGHYWFALWKMGGVRCLESSSSADRREVQHACRGLEGSAGWWAAVWHLGMVITQHATPCQSFTQTQTLHNGRVFLRSHSALWLCQSAAAASSILSWENVLFFKREKRRHYLATLCAGGSILTPFSFASSRTSFHFLQNVQLSLSFSSN